MLDTAAEDERKLWFYPAEAWQAWRIGQNRISDMDQLRGFRTLDQLRGGGVSGGADYIRDGICCNDFHSDRVTSNLCVFGHPDTVFLQQKSYSNRYTKCTCLQKIPTLDYIGRYNKRSHKCSVIVERLHGQTASTDGKQFHQKRQMLPSSLK